MGQESGYLCQNLVSGLHTRSIKMLLGTYVVEIYKFKSDNYFGLNDEYELKKEKIKKKKTLLQHAVTKN